MGEYSRREREYEQQRRRGGLGRLFGRLVVTVLILAALAAAALIYLGKSDEGYVDDMSSGLEVVAERLEKGDREGAAEKLRELKEQMKKAGPVSKEYSAKAKKALSRIKDEGGDLYEKAKDLVKGDGGGDGEAAEGPAEDAAEAPPPAGSGAQ